MANGSTCKKLTLGAFLRQIDVSAPSKIGSVKYRMVKADGRTMILFGDCKDPNSDPFTVALTKSFHRAKIAALREPEPKPALPDSAGVL